MSRAGFALVTARDRLAPLGLGKLRFLAYLHAPSLARAFASGRLHAAAAIRDRCD